VGCDSWAALTVFAELNFAATAAICSVLKSAKSGTRATLVVSTAISWLSLRNT
jgi:hypothetical protein